MQLAPSSAAFAPWEDPAENPLIEFRGVRKNFGSFTAIDGLDLSIYEREFFALLGPSGCGKTTLMRLLAGFETPNEGDILLGGQSIVDVPPNKRPVNMMFQSYALFPHLSVWDNIAFGLKRSDMPKDQIAPRVEEMLRLVQLEPLAKRKPHQISGGQRQRVSLARSLAKSPKLLLLDEPLAALDKKLRQETQFELMDIQEKTGTTFVIVTHDQEEAMTVASRVAVMKDGNILQVATPDAIYETPASAYVADFIGDVTLIEGNVTSVRDGVVTLDWADGQQVLSAHTEASPTEGQRCQFAIRPEKISISGQKPEGVANTMSGKVIDIAYLGNVSTYHVAVANGSIVKAQTSNHSRASARAFTWEDDVWLSFEPDGAVVLTK